MSTPIKALGNKTAEQLKVTELREELKKRGINNKGRKSELVERLDEAVRLEAAEEEDNADDKSGAEGNDEEEEEASTPPPAVAKVVVDSKEDDDAETVAELKGGVVEPEPVESSPEEELPSEGKEGKEITPEDIVVEPELDSKDTVAVDAVDVLAPLPEDNSQPSSQSVDCESRLDPENVPAAAADATLADGGSQPSPKHDNGQSSLEPEIVPAVATVAPLDGGNSQPSAKVEGGESGLESESGAVVDAGDDCKLLEAKTETRSEQVVKEVSDSRTSDYDKVISEVEEVKPEVQKLPEAKLEMHSDNLKPPRGYLLPTSSTDAIIIEASEGDDIPTENTLIFEGLPRSEEGNGDIEEEDRSVVEETGAEAMETVTYGAVTLYETSSVVFETAFYHEAEADISTADRVDTEQEEEGSLSQRSPGEGMLSTKEVKGLSLQEQQHKDKDDDGKVDEEDEKAKDSKPMEIDSDNLTGVKRKDEDESRHQEHTKRQRRWNSENSSGARADAKSSPKVITADTFREAIGLDVREGVSPPLAPSPSTTASSTPKASAPSAPAIVDKPAVSRPILGRTEITVNGEVDKKRQVPPPLRTPTSSLKIDRFVRPFTIKAVKELLGQTGTVEDMWMDQIKTHCYVKYSSVEEAIATRNAVYNLQWPPAGGKLLVAEFVEPEEVKIRIEITSDKSAATSVSTPRGSVNSKRLVAGPVGLTSPAASVPMTALPPPPPLPPPPRERPALPPKKEQEPPIPTLDDLFKKTRTKPQIYFLPLTEEQVVMKLKNKSAISTAPAIA